MRCAVNRITVLFFFWDLVTVTDFARSALAVFLSSGDGLAGM